MRTRYGHSGCKNHSALPASLREAGTSKSTEYFLIIQSSYHGHKGFCKTRFNIVRVHLLTHLICITATVIWLEIKPVR